MGRGLRRLRALTFQSLGLNRLARARLGRTHAAILMYHRVLPEADAARLAVEPAMYVTPEAFEMQLVALREAGFTPTSLAEVCTRIADGIPLEPCSVALSFDDGWRDNHTHALPILVRHDWPATVFAVTDRVGTSGAFWPDEISRRLAGLGDREASDWIQRHVPELGPGADRDRLLDHLKSRSSDAIEVVLRALRTDSSDLADAGRELMNWEELDEMSRAGVDVESHGATHALLDGVSGERATRELEDSLAALRARGHGRHGLFAYPSGALNAEVCTAARAAGYRAAVTTRLGPAPLGHDPLLLPRIGIHQGIGHARAEFLQKVPGYSGWSGARSPQVATETRATP